MNVYSLLSIPVPTVSYCIFHRAPSDQSTEELEKNLKNAHARIREETESLDAAYRKFLRDTVTRETQTLRGMLSQFLHTPISSDDQDVRRLIRESLEKFEGQVTTDIAVGMTSSLEGRVLFPSLKKAREKKLLANGRAYLQELGFDAPKERGEVFEAEFVVRGGLNLDILENLLRTQLPIDLVVNGSYREDPSLSVHSVYALLYLNGDIPRKKEGKRNVEISLFFSTPDSKYAPFGDALVEALQKLTQEWKVNQLSLWQRKLGLGTGREFVLRVLGESIESALQPISWLDSYKDQVAVKQAIVEHGSLVVKELLFQ